jgi:N-glycosylase/DNA lyase
MEYFIKLPHIDLNTTFNCGQCFCWHERDGEFHGCGVVVRQANDGVIIRGVSESDIPRWERYFCADMDYTALIERFSADSVLKSACAFAPGIRVLRQEPFETLISFIVSQNNNIARITGILNKMPSLARCPEDGFPAPEDLARLSECDLAELKLGYRARYVLDAAKKVESGEIMLDEIQNMDYNSAKRELLRIVGVGEKVADCVLLFGFGKYEAFPRDVWIKRVLARCYPDGLPDCIRGYEGIAQQFLFHYIRSKNI